MTRSLILGARSLGGGKGMLHGLIFSEVLAFIAPISSLSLSLLDSLDGDDEGDEDVEPRAMLYDIALETFRITSFRGFPIMFSISQMI